VLDHLAVVIAAPKPDVVLGLAQVPIPPVQVDEGVVIENVDVVRPVPAPQDAVLGRLEALVERMHADRMAVGGDRIENLPVRVAPGRAQCRGRRILRE
jgi:hypothetical protein